MICEFRLRIGLKNCPAIVSDNTAFASTTNGEFALNGAVKVLMRLKLLIIIEV